MSLTALWRRYQNLSPEDRAYYRRRFVDLKLHARSSFSQFGEDASVMEYFRTLGQKTIRYLDLGGNDPVVHSNTYLFYRYGSAGVVVDANPKICALQRKKRPRDVVVNCAVGPQSGPPIELQIMDMDGLSTVSDDWSDRLQSDGLARIVERVKVELVGVNDLLADRFPDQCPDFVSLDVEGMDYVVLDAWDFDRWRPRVFCVETGVLQKGRYQKDGRFAELMRGRGYEPLFETFANTIFVTESTRES
jgi:FkbM family methyltransferase